MPASPPEILYDSGPCLVVNKPAGVLTQAPAGIDSLELRVKDFYREREGKDGNIYLGLPHRLCDWIARGTTKLFRPPIPARLAKDPLPESQRILASRHSAIATCASPPS